MSWFPKLLVKPFAIKPSEFSQLLTPFATLASAGEPEPARCWCCLPEPHVAEGVKPPGSTEPCTTVGCALTPQHPLLSCKPLSPPRAAPLGATCPPRLLDLAGDPRPTSTPEQWLTPNLGVVRNACSADLVVGCSRHFSRTACPMPEGQSWPVSRPPRGLKGSGTASAPREIKHPAQGAEQNSPVLVPGGVPGLGVRVIAVEVVTCQGVLLQKEAPA